MRSEGGLTETNVMNDNKCLTGRVATQQRYKPCPQGVLREGEVRGGGNALPTDNTYTGQKTDEPLGLMFYNARWYDPLLGRFAQADSLIPQPGSPLAWDRYAYSRNNPINYNDPTGHCTGDRYDQNNPDIDCWNKLDDLSKKYINVTIDSNFDLAKLVLIGLSLDDIYNVFNNDMTRFQKALGNFSINYLSWWNGGITPPGMRSIYLGENTFTQNGAVYPYAVQLIIHEIGHIFDFNNNPKSLYKSDTFISTFNKSNNLFGCWIGLLGCLGRDAPVIYKLVNTFSAGRQNPFGDTFGYEPSGKPSDYGKISSIEDFAESFSGYVLRSNGVATSLPKDDVRNFIIATWVNLAGK